MPSIGLTVYLQLPDPTKRRKLHPCMVTQISDQNTMTVIPADQTLDFEVAQEFLINYERNRKFMQQAASVEALIEYDAGTSLELRTIGEAVSADTRQCYRVKSTLCDLFATIEGLERCPVHDISVSGFSVTSPREYKIGRIIAAELHFEGQDYSGQASIQSAFPLPDGNIRYGVHCIKMASGPRTLTSGIQSISMEIQRRQLNRLAGGGG